MMITIATMIRIIKMIMVIENVIFYSIKLQLEVSLVQQTLID